MLVNKINIGIFYFVLILLFSCVQKPKEEESVLVQKVGADSLKIADEAIKNLKLEKIKKGEFPDELSVMGKVSVPEDRITVVPARVSGRIDSVYVASGETVTKGQKLASIFGADFVVAKEEYVQTLKQVQESSSDEARHLLNLSKKKLMALGMSEEDIVSYGKNPSGGLDNLTMRAPHTGAILEKKAIVGNLVNQGDTLFTIGDLSKVWFSGDVYPEDLAKIHKDQELIVDGINGENPIHGNIFFISPVVDSVSRTVKIRALMDNSKNTLRPDMFVKGSLILSKKTAVIAPKNAIIRARDTVFCFKRFPGNIFKRIIVMIVGESSNLVAISGGLDDGDEVVSEGALLLDSALLNGEN